MLRKKPIGLYSAVAIGIGAMVGAGIFSVLGVACHMSGNATFISFVIAGIVTLLSAYSYAKLAAAYPSAGGAVEFLIRGYGEGVVSGGFNIFLWVTYVIGLALFAKTFGGYAATFLPAGAPPIWKNVFATAVVLFFTVINFIGSRAVGRSEVLIVFFKLAIIFTVAGVGFFFIKPALLSEARWPSPSHVLSGAALVFITYSGFGLITNAAEDVANPRKTIPRATYLAVLIVIALYVLISIVVLGNLPLESIARAKDYVLAEAARPFLGLIGFKIVAVTALLSTSSAINAQLYGGANVSYMIAREGELPRVFERKLWRRSREGLFITAGLTLLFANFFNLERIAMLASAAFLIVYAAVNVGHLRLHKKTGGKRYLIWPAAIGCVGSLAFIVYYEVSDSPLTLIVLAGVFAFSFAAEWVYRRISGRTLKLRFPIKR